MKLEKIQIENFRSFKDETVFLDDYTCLVGPNGCGKSTVLTALNVFFRNTASSATNVVSLGKEDFHHFDTSQPVKITLTFKDLSDEAKEDLQLYYRQGRLTVIAKATWNPASESAEVKQYGERMVMKDFAPYFKAVEDGAKAPQLKEIFDGIHDAYPDLPNATSGPAREKALREYEEAHPELCEPVESVHQFFGFTKGSNLLSRYVQWVYVPAVKDASTEQEESSKTALGQLFERSIRTKVNFKDSIAELRQGLEKQYRDLIDAETNSLDELAASMQGRLRDWASPGATLQLAWHFDPNKAVVVNEPVARATIGEDGFIGQVARLGHGMQRSFLVALLHELAMSNGDDGPTLLLGFEEPELYQHPSQALHMANVLEELASHSTTNSQVIISTHSPHFVSARGFENVRVVRKHHVNKCSLVASTRFIDIAGILSNALGTEPLLPSVMMTSLEQIMQPSLRELYFTKYAVLVEGIEDIAFIATHLHLTNRWHEFRKHGCHFITAAGKTNLSRPVAIAKELCIRHFVVFDADSNKMKEKEQHKRDNSCILRLCGLADFDPLPSEILWADRVVMWPTCIFDSVRDNFGTAEWEEAEKKARRDKGCADGVKQKNNLLIAAVLEELAQRGKFSNVLDKLCDQLLRKAAHPADGEAPLGHPAGSNGQLEEILA